MSSRCGFPDAVNLAGSWYVCTDGPVNVIEALCTVLIARSMAAKTGVAVVMVVAASIGEERIVRAMIQDIPGCEDLQLLSMPTQDIRAGAGVVVHLPPPCGEQSRERTRLYKSAQSRILTSRNVWVVGDLELTARYAHVQFLATMIDRCMTQQCLVPPSRQWLLGTGLEELTSHHRKCSDGLSDRKKPWFVFQESDFLPPASQRLLQANRHRNLTAVDPRRFVAARLQS